MTCSCLNCSIEWAARPAYMGMCQIEVVLISLSTQLEQGTLKTQAPQISSTLVQFASSSFDSSAARRCHTALHSNSRIASGAFPPRQQCREPCKSAESTQMRIGVSMGQTLHRSTPTTRGPLLKGGGGQSVMQLKLREVAVVLFFFF